MEFSADFWSAERHACEQSWCCWLGWLCWIRYPFFSMQQFNLKFLKISAVSKLVKKLENSQKAGPVGSFRCAWKIDFEVYSTITSKTSRRSSFLEIFQLFDQFAGCGDWAKYNEIELINEMMINEMEMAVSWMNIFKW